MSTVVLKMVVISPFYFYFVLYNVIGRNVALLKGPVLKRDQQRHKQKKALYERIQRITNARGPGSEVKRAFGAAAWSGVPNTCCMSERPYALAIVPLSKGSSARTAQTLSSYI